MASATRHYRLYIDESGTPIWGFRSTEGERYLCIAGVIIELQAYQAFVADLDAIKSQFFESDPDTPIILHREDIIGRNGVFQIFEDDDTRAQFNSAFVQFCRTHAYRLIGIVVDNQEHHDRYGRLAQHPYHFCIEAIAERFCMFLKRRNATGEIFAEPRGKKEDGLLMEAWQKCRDYGTRYWSGDKIRSFIPDGEIKMRSKPYNVAGLQLADMLAYTMKWDILIEYRQKESFKTRLDSYIADAIASHYDCKEQTGETKGYGKVLLSCPVPTP